ncbi:MAG: PAS domain S-box protein [Desulfobulbales bacterium]|nr:PAS domain S-box protein [Desulfobulbales bacterium]
MNNENLQELKLLRKNEQRLRLLLDTMTHGVQESDCQGTITYSNRAHHDMLGYNAGELLGRKIWHLVASDEDKKYLKNYLADLVQHQPPPVPFITKNRRKDGSLVDIQIDWDYEYDSDGKLSGFISVITDITERKQSEEALLKRTQGLATLLEVSRSLAATLDMQNILQVSVEGVVRLAGLDTAAIYLLAEDNLHLSATTPPLPPECPDELRIAPLADHPHIQRAIHSKKYELVHDFCSVDTTSAEKRIIEQRGLCTLLFIPIVVDAESIGAFIVGSVGKPTQISELEISLASTLANLAALTIKNAQLYERGKDYAVQLQKTLDDHLKSEEEKGHLEAQLFHAQKMESIGRLAGGVAHDFNNMLTVILGQADLALLKIDSNNRLRRDLLQIRNAAEKSARLTRQLLAFARKQTISPKLLDLNDIIEDMLKMLRRLIGEDIDLVWIPGAHTGLVKIDPAQIDQILANLCVNARDAISKNGRVIIETRTQSLDAAYCENHPGFVPGTYVMLAISDNGIGMEQEILANIFEPFYSTKKTGEGTGLGLAMVYGIVKQNNGFINVYSEPGLGTTIKIYLPQHAIAGEESAHKVEDKVFEGGNERILLVEDEPAILNLTRTMLESLGYNVLCTTSPVSALSIAEEHADTIDLLITDVVMPEMNGHELTEKLRIVRPDIKTLFISGYTANVIAHHGVLHEGAILLAKPYTRNELAAKVREILDR